MEETIEYKGYTIQIEQDIYYPSNPRKDWDPISTILSCHDKIDDECKKEGVVYDENEEYDWEATKALYVFNVKMVAILPLYFREFSYDCDLNTTGAGKQIGFVYISKEMWESHMGKTDESSDWWQEYHKGKSKADVARRLITGEIKTYQQWLNNEVYSYSIEGDDFEDRCSGYYGDDHEASGLLEAAKESIDCHLNWILKERLKVLKGYLKAKVPIMYRFAS